jgi:hypothetical protein
MNFAIIPHFCLLPTLYPSLIYPSTHPSHYTTLLSFSFIHSSIHPFDWFPSYLFLVEGDLVCLRSDIDEDLNASEKQANDRMNSFEKQLTLSSRRLEKEVKQGK